MSECVICSRDGLEPETSVALANGLRHQACPRLEDGDFRPFERHEMPIGWEVFYRDSDHTYYGEVKPVYQGRGAGRGIVGYQGTADSQMSSPSAISKYADPDAEKLMGYVLRVQRGEFKNDEEAVLAAAPELGVNLAQPKHNILRDAKGKVGDIAHAAGEAILNGQELAESHPVAKGYVDAVVKFFADLGIFQILQSEVVVYSKEHGYAGRFDARIAVPSHHHNGDPGLEDPAETWLLDFKTSGYIGKAYHNQMAGYDLAAEECGYGAADRLVIVQLRADGSYIPWPCRGSRQGFLWNLASYNDGKRMDVETKADWAELVAA